MADEPNRNPTADEIAGMQWWNSLTETERADCWPGRIRQCLPRLGQHINVKERSIYNLLAGSTRAADSRSREGGRRRLGGVGVDLPVRRRPGGIGVSRCRKKLTEASEVGMA